MEKILKQGDSRIVKISTKELNIDIKNVIDIKILLCTSDNKIHNKYSLIKQDDYDEILIEIDSISFELTKLLTKRLPQGYLKCSIGFKFNDNTVKEFYIDINIVIINGRALLHFTH